MPEVLSPVLFEFGIFSLVPLEPGLTSPPLLGCYLHLLTGLLAPESAQEHGTDETDEKTGQ